MTRRRPSPKVLSAYVSLYEDVFFEVMSAMMKADSIEVKYAQFQEASKQRTKRQLRQIARLAAEYFVKHSHIDPKKMSAERVDELKVAAIKFALEQLSDE